MPGRIEAHGDIETMVSGDGSAGIGDRVLLVFRAIDDPEPPIGIVIQAPNGQKIVEKVLRELPTGLPQSAPPVEFVPSAKGLYQIEVKELRGKQRGTAVLRVG
jgi:hypothetical protein